MDFQMTNRLRRLEWFTFQITLLWKINLIFKHLQIYRIMNELPWITIFWWRVKLFANDFHEWPSQEWKYLANYITSDQKSLFEVTNVLVYFLSAILCFKHTVPLKISSIAHLAIVAKNGLFCLSIVTSPHLIGDVTRTSIVTSNSSIVFARANWCDGDFR